MDIDGCINAGFEPYIAAFFGRMAMHIMDTRCEMVVEMTHGNVLGVRLVHWYGGRSVAAAKEFTINSKMYSVGLPRADADDFWLAFSRRCQETDR